MPVLVSCSCGKQLRVPDAHAGKRIKCPGCGDPILVPDGDEDEAPAAKRRPARNGARNGDHDEDQAPAGKNGPASAGMLRFSCECGKVMQAKAEYAGQSTVCPACKAEVDIPEDPIEERAARIRADKPAAKKPAGRGKADRDEDEDEDRPRKRARQEDEEEDEDEPRSKKKKGKGAPKKKGMLLVLLAGAAMMLFLCGGLGLGLADYFFFNIVLGGGGADLAMIPPDAQGFVTIRVADAWKLDRSQRQWNQLKAVTGPGGSDDPVQFAQNKFGLAPADIDRLTVVVMDGNREEIWVIIQTNKAYDQKRILDNMSNASEVTHEGKKYHAGGFNKAAGGPPKGGGPRPGGMGGPGGMGPPGGMGSPSGGKKDALYFPSKRVFVFSPEAGMKRLLTYLANKKKSGPLDDAIKLAGSKNYHVVGGLNLPSSTRDNMKRGIPPGQREFASLLDFQVGTLLVKMGDTWQVDITARYGNDGQAGDAKRSLDKAKKALLPFVEGMAEGGDAQGKEGGTALKNTLEGITIEQKGPNVTLKIKVDTKAADALKPRPAKPGPGPRPGPRRR